MNTTTSQAVTGLRIKSYLGAIAKIFKLVAESTHAPTSVSTPLRPSLRDQRAQEQRNIGFYKGNAMDIFDIEQDCHCSMDPISELAWMKEHTLPGDVAGESVRLKLDALLQERQVRESFTVIGSSQLDTKRLRMEYQGEEHVVRKVEFVTRKPDHLVAKNEHPELSHEWHKYFLVFSQEGYIVDLVEA